jgi:hypothetical protein
MFTTLAVALSIATTLAIDVPYLPQTDALCGGAAAAMVFRFWGDAHADAQSFAPLVDRDAGGIANGVLTRAIEGRGWRTASAGGSLDALRASLREHRPVIVLLPDRGDRYHYVVVIGATSDAIVVHDPSWGPSRSIRAPDFEREWKAAGFWSLVVSPPSLTPKHAVERVAPTPVATDPGVADSGTPECDARLDRALADIRAQGLAHADTILAGVRAGCPGAAGPLRELSALRFAQRRWSEASALARQAIRLDPHDDYALDVLGSSLFMQHDELGALRAWNRIGKPRVNVVRIEGLHHIRYQTVAAVMDLQPNMLLTAERFERARRRLNELPDRAATRLAVKPEADGFATVDVVVVELAAIPRGAIEWAGAAARTATSREVEVSVPGVSGQGDVWSAGWRWWNNRPAVSVGLATPRVGRLPGVWRFDGSWESDAFTAMPSASVVESRLHGGLTISDWLSGGVRYSVATGVDGWSGGRKAASIGGSLERAAFDDRVRLTIAATQWAPIAEGAAFHSIGARATTQSSADAIGWVVRGSVGIERVSEAAPLALWPGAGEGQVRTPLLRAHPLLNDGAIDLTAAAAFGRTLAFGSAEMQRWLDRPSLVRLGVAGFADIARASRQADGGATPVQVDLGVGLRVKIPGTPGVLRADVARGLRDGANALTIGWLFESEQQRRH